MGIKDFKEALKKVYENDIDKIINHDYKDYTKSRSYISQEKRRAKADKEFLKSIAKTDLGILEAPYIVMLNEIKSADVLRNVICYMLKGE